MLVKSYLGAGQWFHCGNVSLTLRMSERVNNLVDTEVIYYNGDYVRDQLCLGRIPKTPKLGWLRLPDSSIGFCQW